MRRTRSDVVTSVDGRLVAHAANRINESEAVCFALKNVFVTSFPSEIESCDEDYQNHQFSDGSIHARSIKPA